MASLITSTFGAIGPINVSRSSNITDRNLINEIEIRFGSHSISQGRRNFNSGVTPYQFRNLRETLDRFRYRPTTIRYIDYIDERYSNLRKRVYNGSEIWQRKYKNAYDVPDYGLRVSLASEHDITLDQGTKNIFKSNKRREIDR